MRLLSVAQGVAGFGVVELAERDGLAGFGGTALLAVLAHELEYSRDTSGLPVGIQEIGAVSDFSREHAGDRHLAAVRAVDGLEHVSNGLTRLQAEPLCGVGDARRLVPQRLHQPQHAIGARRRAEQYGTDLTF